MLDTHLWLNMFDTSLRSAGAHIRGSPYQKTACRKEMFGLMIQVWTDKCQLYTRLQDLDISLGNLYK